MLNSNNIELYIINAILLKKDNYFKIFEEISENFISNDAIKELYLYLKDRSNNKLDFDIEVYGMKYNIEELLLEIKSLEEDFEINYLIEFFLEKSKNSILEKALKTMSKGFLSSEDKTLVLKDLLEEIEEQNYISVLPNAKSAISKYRDYIKELIELNKNSEDGLIGISTGIRELNQKIKGLKHQDYILIGARPSQGKTALVLKFFTEAIFANKVPVFFSLEMQKEQLVSRMLTQVNTDLEMNNTMYGIGYEDKKIEIEELLDFLEEKDFFIEDFISENGATKAKITMNDLRIKTKEIAKSLPEEKSIGLIIIDYLQLMSPETVRNGMSTNDIISDISKGLKNLGRMYQCPIVVLSQLNRDLEKRQDKRPQLSDLRDSGAIEQDADIIMFVYRNAVYLEKEIREQLKKKPNDPELLRELKIIEQQTVSDAEIIIGKQRNGPIGIVNAEFYKKCSMFGDVNEFEEDDFLDATNQNSDIYEKE